MPSSTVGPRRRPSRGQPPHPTGARSPIIQARGRMLRPEAPMSARGALEHHRCALAWRTVAHPFAALHEEGRLVRARP
jgi:hypothetical protein